MGRGRSLQAPLESADQVDNNYLVVVHNLTLFFNRLYRLIELILTDCV